MVWFGLSLKPNKTDHYQSELNTIDLSKNYNWAISNGVIDITKDLDLTNIKKYLKYIG